MLLLLSSGGTPHGRRLPAAVSGPRFGIGEQGLLEVGQQDHQPGDGDGDEDRGGYREEVVNVVHICGWLAAGVLVRVSTGKESSLRVFVWRQLRKLGAVYLHQSVCLLPDRAEVRARLRPVVVRVRGQGGQVRLLSIHITGDDYQQLNNATIATSSTPRWWNAHRSCWPSSR